MKFLRFLWLNGPFGEKLELALDQSTYIQEQTDGRAYCLLNALQQLLSGQSPSIQNLPEENSWFVLELKIKRSIRCLLVGQQQGVPRIFWLKNAWETDLVKNKEGGVLSFSSLRERIKEKAIATCDISLSQTPFQPLPKAFAISAYQENWKDIWLASIWPSLSPFKRLLIPQSTSYPISPLLDLLKPYIRDQQEVSSYSELLEERQELLHAGESWHNRHAAVRELEDQIKSLEDRQTERFKKLEAERESLQSQIALLQRQTPQSLRRQKKQALLEAKIEYGQQRLSFYEALNVAALAEQVAEIPHLEALLWNAGEDRAPATFPEATEYWKLMSESLQAGLQMQEAFANLLVEQQATFTHQSDYLTDVLAGLEDSLKEQPDFFADLQSPDNWITSEKKLLQLEVELEQQEKRLKQQLEEREQAEDQLSLESKSARSLFETEIASLETGLRHLTEQEKDHKQSLLFWLQNNYPDWQSRFGKVLRQEVLRQAYLSPRIERINEQLFGISLDLEEIELPELPETDFVAQQQNLKKTLDQRKHEWVREEDQLRRKKENLQKRWKQRTKEQQRKIERLRYQVEQTELRLRKMRTDYHSRIKSQQQQRQKARLSQQFALAELQKAAQIQIQALEKSLTHLQASWDQLAQKWQQDWNEKQLQLQVLLSKTSRSKNGKSHDESDRRSTLIQLSQARLFQPLVLLYHQESRSLLDRLPEWEEELESLHQPKVSFPDHLQLTVLIERLQEIEAEQLEDPLAELQTQLVQRQQARNDSKDHFIRLQQAFLGYFRPEGTFGGFHRSPIEEFTEYLRSFMSGDTLKSLVEQLGVKHAPLLSQVNEKFPSTSWLEKVNEDLDKWNHNYADECGFYLKQGGSNHELAALIQRMRNFHQRYIGELGAPSLFSRPKEGDRNQEAVDLLAQLYKALSTYPHAEIMAEDLLSLCLIPQDIVESTESFEPDRFPAALPDFVQERLRLYLLLGYLDLIEEKGSPLPSIFLWPSANSVETSDLARLFAKCESLKIRLLTSALHPFENNDGKVLRHTL